MKNISVTDIDTAAIHVGYAIQKSIVVLGSTLPKPEHITIDHVLNVAELILSRIPE